MSLGDKQIWIQNCPIAGLTDGQPVNVIGFVEVKEPKQYETVLGSTITVPCVELVSLKDNQELEDVELEKMAAESRRREVAGHPKWTLKDGSSFFARFDQFKSGQVELIELDTKKTLKHKLSEFEKDDLLELREVIKAAEEKNKRSRK